MSRLVFFFLSFLVLSLLLFFNLILSFLISSWFALIHLVLSLLVLFRPTLSSSLWSRLTPSPHLGPGDAAVQGVVLLVVQETELQRSQSGCGKQKHVKHTADQGTHLGKDVLLP